MKKTIWNLCKTSPAYQIGSLHKPERSTEYDLRQSQDPKIEAQMLPPWGRLLLQPALSKSIFSTPPLCSPETCVYSTASHCTCLPASQVSLYAQALGLVSPVFPVLHTAHSSRLKNVCFIKGQLMTTHTERLKLSSWNVKPCPWSTPKHLKHKIVTRGPYS